MVSKKKKKCQTVTTFAQGSLSETVDGIWVVCVFSQYIKVSNFFSQYIWINTVL